MIGKAAWREGEVAVDSPAPRDAGLLFIGRIRTPWSSREDTPRQGRDHLEVIYWLHQSRRDLVLQSPKNDKSTRGTFSLRSPQRPNPIGTSIVKLVGVEGNTVFVRGLDCLDETPLIDLKPDRCEFTPSTEQQTGNIEGD